MDFITGQIQISGNTYKLNMPNHCPVCGERINPEVRYISGHMGYHFLYFTCTYYECRKSFIGLYKRVADDRLEHIYSYPQYAGPHWDDEVVSVSPGFARWYEQAYRAESARDIELAIAGYRCALEVLVKDYALKFKEAKPEELARLRLDECLQKYLPALDESVVAYWSEEYANSVVRYPAPQDAGIEFDTFKLFDEITFDAVRDKIKLAFAQKRLPEALRQRLGLPPAETPEAASEPAAPAPEKD